MDHLLWPCVFRVLLLVARTMCTHSCLFHACASPVHRHPPLARLCCVGVALHHARLLCPTNPPTQPTQPNPTQPSHKVESKEDALQLLFAGNANRITAETASNLASSRSHCVFTVILEAREAAASDVVRVSKLHLVDLAGSERMSTTSSGSSGAGGAAQSHAAHHQLTRREGKHINLSLHYLQQVIAALQSRGGGAHSSRRGGGNKPHVPYRNSMLTSVLRDR